MLKSYCLCTGGPIFAIMRLYDSIKLYVPAVRSNCITDLRLNNDEILLLGKVNEERTKSGLPALLVDCGLVRLARIKCNDMFEENYFGHVSPIYGTPLDMVKKSGITARVMGAENIAKAKTVLRVHTLLMGSKEHRDNILNPLHDSIGIGVLKNIYGVFATQLFIGH